MFTCAVLQAPCSRRYELMDKQCTSVSLHKQRHAPAPHRVVYLTAVSATGQFKDVDTASVAWQAADAARQAGGSAEEVKLAAKSAGSGEIQVEGVEGAAGTATSVPPVDVSSEDYIGVASAGDGQWEAVFTTAKGLQVSGGSYDSPEEAARAYDALARMYEGSGATTNFVVDTYSGWVPPDEVDEAAAIPVRPR